jgi:hypothetical protein
MVSFLYFSLGFLLQEGFFLLLLIYINNSLSLISLFGLFKGKMIIFITLSWPDLVSSSVVCFLRIFQGKFIKFLKLVFMLSGNGED